MQRTRKQGMKIQDPRSRIQTNSKLQAPKFTDRLEHSWVFGAWCFFGAWCLVFGVCTASAFPPAPHHTLYGLVRDQWGDPMNVAGAEVFMEITGARGAATTLSPALAPGVNYRLLVPMDAGTAPDLYKDTALATSFPFRLRVKIGQTTYLPIEMTVQPAQIGQPAQSTRLDLTLGEDTDGDGLPDAWERALIAALGGNLALAAIRPNDDADGDGISNLNEYLAGTYAFDPSDGFSLTLVGFNAGASVLEFLALRGHTYAIESSFDLKQWAPVQFRLTSEGPSAPARDNYLASDARVLRVEVPFQSGGQTNRYFKARVQ
jgi:hypothetical protein